MNHALKRAIEQAAGVHGEFGFGGDLQPGFRPGLVGGKFVVGHGTPGQVTVLPAQTPKLSLQILAGYPVIGLDGKVGTNYVIQYKDSLMDATWTPLLNFNMLANPFTYFDTSASGAPRRYYRAYAN